MALPRSPRIPSAFLLPPRWSPAASSRGPAVSSGDAEQLYHCSKPNTIRKVSLQQQLNRITHSEPKETSLGDVSGSRLLRSTDVTVTLSSSCPLAAPSPAACTRAEPAPGVRAPHEAHHAGWVHVADGLSQRGRCPPLGTCHVPALPGGTGHGVPEDARSGGAGGSIGSCPAAPRGNDGEEGLSRSVDVCRVHVRVRPRHGECLEEAEGRRKPGAWRHRDPKPRFRPGRGCWSIGEGQVLQLTLLRPLTPTQGQKKGGSLLEPPSSTPRKQP